VFTPNRLRSSAPAEFASPRPACAPRTIQESTTPLTGFSDDQSSTRPSRLEPHTLPKQFQGDSSQFHGAQGRIRTSVGRLDRQIYSLLPLTARPPVHICRAPAGTRAFQISKTTLALQPACTRKLRIILSSTGLPEAAHDGINSIRAHTSYCTIAPLLRKMLLELLS
jgi:hypothetical protein